MRIAVVGAGGVGGYFGARFAAAGHDVTFLARGANLAALRSRGITVLSPRGDLTIEVAATDDPHAVGGCEGVLLAVKDHALAGALPMLEPLLAESGWVAVLLNGGPAPSERVARAVGPERTVAGAAYISCHLRAPGVLEHHSALARLVLGEFSGGRGERLEGFAAMAREADVDVEVTDEVRVALWSKFAFICALAGATASTGRPIGEVRATPAGRAMLRGLVGEATAVARAEGVALPKDYEVTTLAALDSIDAGMRSSLYEDVAHGRATELEALHGEVMRRAASVGVAIPVTGTVYAVLEPWAAGAESPRWPHPSEAR